MVSQSAQVPAPHALIIGCGYLGLFLARRLMDRDVQVFGTTRHEARARQMARVGIRPLLVQVTQPVTFAALKPALDAPALDVIYMVPPGRPGNSPSPRQVVLGGIAHMVRQLRHGHVRRAILVSSTAVYSQQEGQRVDADSPAQPIDERGQLLLQGEQLWRDAGDDYYVLRLAGLYGPTRIIGMRAIQDQSPLIGDPQALLNLIHVDDAASLLMAMMQAAEPGRIELGCDGHPVPRLDYYQYLASRLGMPAPVVMDDEQAASQLGLNVQRLRRSSSKALDNLATCQRTGWSPQYPYYKAGIEASLNTGL